MPPPPGKNPLQVFIITPPKQAEPQTEGNYPFHLGKIFFRESILSPSIKEEENYEEVMKKPRNFNKPESWSKFCATLCIFGA